MKPCLGGVQYWKYSDDLKINDKASSAVKLSDLESMIIVWIKGFGSQRWLQLSQVCVLNAFYFEFIIVFCNF